MKSVGGKLMVVPHNNFDTRLLVILRFTVFK
jgi:hypothetical protein